MSMTTPAAGRKYGVHAGSVKGAPTLTPAVAGSVLYAAVFASILAYLFWVRGIELIGHGVYFCRIGESERTGSCDRIAGIFKTRIANCGARICEMTAKLHLRQLCAQERQARIICIGQCHAFKCGGSIIETCLEQSGLGHAQSLFDDRIKFSCDDGV